MLHIRNNPENKELNAYSDALEILKQHAKVKGDVHFFAGSLEDAKGFVDFGFTLSFTGVITFAKNYDEVIRNTPLDMIMSETDAPYVSPVPYRGKRNEPIYVSEVVKRISEIKNIPLDTVSEALIANAKRVWKI
jgi:TatD DNase family protein